MSNDTATATGTPLMVDTSTQTDPPSSSMDDQITAKSSNEAYIIAALEEIKRDTRRNSDVATLYGDKAAFLFSIADHVSLMINRITYPISYIASGGLSNLVSDE